MAFNSTQVYTDKTRIGYFPGQTATGKGTYFLDLPVGRQKPCILRVKTRSKRVLEKLNEPPPSEGHTSGSEEGSMEHTFELMDIVPPTPYDLPLQGGYTPGSDEGRLKLKELMAMCTKLSKQVLDLEKEKDAQAVEILKLKKRVKKLERKRNSSISHPRRRIYKQVESSDDDLDEEDASEQGSKSDKTKSMFKDSDFNVLDDDIENVEGETVNIATTGVSAVSAPVTTVGVAISTVEREHSKQLLLPTPPAYKGNGVLVEEEPKKPEKVKGRDQGLAQFESDAELAQRLHEEELAELDKAQKEKQKQEEATNVALAEEFDEIQARMDADHELAVRLTHEEQEIYTIEERATLLAEYFKRRKKQLAAKRAEAIRNKPPTRAQVRNKMITYLKHIGYELLDIRNLLDEKFLPKVEVATRWIKNIPIKINIFAWKVCLDRLPTRLNLAHRDIQVSSLDCSVCSLSHETSNDYELILLANIINSI
ncbi:putative ribonuclease H-like domain-containing protein [Tanacetum coccineum]